MAKHKMLPMPDANVGEVLGLVEIIYAYKGRVKVSFLAEELRIDLDELNDVIEMARLLNLVRVKAGIVELTVFGESLNLGTIDDKKKVLRKNIVRIEPFKSILAIIKKDGHAHNDEIVRALRERNVVIEDEARFHKLLLTWGGYAEIFEYDGTKRVFTPARHAQE
jgi:NitT/TauT family transport system ATP-binding protein